MKRLKHSEVLSILKAVPEGDFSSLKLNPLVAAATATLYKMNPERFILAKRLANTGSRGAREHATTTLSDTLGLIAETYRYPHNSAKTIDEACRITIQRRKEHVEGEMLLQWNLRNVIHETGASFPVHALKDVDFIFGKAVQEAFQREKEDWFWRGFAAVLIINGGESIEAINDVENRDFIKLAGTHPDIAKVIRVGRELGILRAAEIETLMDANSPIPTALITGTL